MTLTDTHAKALQVIQHSDNGPHHTEAIKRYASLYADRLVRLHWITGDEKLIEMASQVLAKVKELPEISVD